MKKQSLYYLAIYFLLFSGCNNTCEPFEPLPYGISVFSILDNRLPFQYVRINRLYQNESKLTELENTTVYLQEGFGINYILRDTVLPFNEHYKYYYLPNYHLKRGSFYKLLVFSEHNTLQWADTYIWNNPIQKAAFRDTLISFNPTNNIFGRHAILFFDKNCPNNFTVKFFIEYQINNDTSLLNAEVPYQAYAQQPNANISYYKKNDVFTEAAPIIKKEDLIKYVSDNDNLKIVFRDNNVLFTLYNLIENSETTTETITIKRGYFVFYSLDDNIFDYFLNFLVEQNSIRMDAPFDISNFQSTDNNKHGFFGNITADTINCYIPDNFIKRYEYSNGQK